MDIKDFLNKEGLSYDQAIAAINNLKTQDSKRDFEIKSAQIKDLLTDASKAVSKAVDIAGKDEKLMDVLLNSINLEELFPKKDSKKKSSVYISENGKEDIEAERVIQEFLDNFAFLF